MSTTLTQKRRLVTTVRKGTVGVIVSTHWDASGVVDLTLSPAHDGDSWTNSPHSCRGVIFSLHPAVKTGA